MNLAKILIVVIAVLIMAWYYVLWVAFKLPVFPTF